MNMRLNPIVKKDVKVQSRSMRICWGVFAYEGILALVFFLTMLSIQESNRYSVANIYSQMVWLYPILAVTQMVILGVVVPIRTASSISGEKERQTFDIMMTTSMTPFAIVWGKVMTAVIQSMLFVAASMPVMALPFVIGGMPWSALFWFLAITLLLSFFAASIGILCSSFCRKTVSAVIFSYGFYFLFFVGTVLPFILVSLLSMNTGYSSTYTFSGAVSYSWWENILLFLLLNPAVYLTEFFMRIMTGESIVNTISYGRLSGATQIGGPIRLVATGNRWMIVSTILLLAVSFLFLLLAARRINPMIRRRVKTHGRKKVSDRTA